MIEKLTKHNTSTDKPQRRKGRLQQRLREINAMGEKELAAILETIEKAKAAFRAGRS